MINTNAAENKFLAAIRKLSKVKIPKNASIEDYEKIAVAIDYKKLQPYIQRYAISVLRNNRNGFKGIINALIRGSNNPKAQDKLNKAFANLMKEEKIFKPILDKFQQNVKLIKNIPDYVAERLKSAYEKGISFRGNEIEKFLQSELGKRAKLIVRTESSKLSSALTETRARTLGIPAYIWSTSSDQRVRPSHQFMDGTMVFWNTTLTLDKMQGHAGEFPNCRCVGIPVVELEDIQFPIKVAENNPVVNSKYVKGSKGKKYDVKIEHGTFKSYTKSEFMQKYGHLWRD